MPPMAVKTIGVNEPCSICRILELYIRFFSFSFESHALEILEFLNRLAIGLKTLTSKNAFWPGIQNPLAAISRRALSWMFVVFVTKLSPDKGVNVGSTLTSLQTCVRREAVISRIELCLWMTNPPFLHESEWSKLNCAPHAQVVGRRLSWWPYRNLIRSQNDCLSIWKPSSLIGSVDNQREAPGSWWISISFFNSSGDWFLIVSSFWRLSWFRSFLNDSFSFLISSLSMSWFCVLMLVWSCWVNWRQKYFQFEEMQCRVFILPIIVLCFSLVKYDVHILFDDNKVLHTYCNDRGRDDQDPVKCLASVTLFQNSNSI